MSSRPVENYEGENDRARQRSSLRMTRQVWARSPTPPRTKENVVRGSKRNHRSTIENKKIYDPNRSNMTVNDDNANETSVAASSSHISQTLTKESNYLNDLADSIDISNPIIQWKRNYEESVEDYGPQPVESKYENIEDKNLTYGKALRPGEGAAIAQFVQQNMRIPRRGEIGWEGEEIQKLEETGYVMSGSRHKRMNAVRIRKENQVYSAEEKRALAIITLEEKQQKDNKIISDFKQILREKLGTGM